MNAFSALGVNLHFGISSYFVISDLAITGVHCSLLELHSVTRGVQTLRSEE